MRLVIVYTEEIIPGYGSYKTLPFEYESIEAAQRDLALDAAHGKPFTIFGHHFTPESFYYKSLYKQPIILTLDEWFNKYL